MIHEKESCAQRIPWLQLVVPEYRNTGIPWSFYIYAANRLQKEIASCL